MPNKRISWTSRPQGDARTAAVLWSAFFLAVLAYGMLGYLYAPTTPRPAVPVWILLLVGIVMVTVALLVPRFLPPAAASTRKRGHRGLSRDISQWALDEAVGLIGLVWRLLGGEWRECALFLLVSGVLLWFHRPRE